jgi:TB2/DP1, HVA22 family
LLAYVPSGTLSLLILALDGAEYPLLVYQRLASNQSSLVRSFVDTVLYGTVTLYGAATRFLSFHFIMEISPEAIASIIALALTFALVILATWRFRRTKGRLWKFHVIYIVSVTLLVGITPLSIKQVVFSTTGVVVAGTIFPFYESLRALCTPSTADDMEWLQYWTAAGTVSFVTAYLKDYKIASDHIQLVWFQFEFFFFIWLYLPFTVRIFIVFSLPTTFILSSRVFQSLSFLLVPMYPYYRMELP